MNIEKTSSKLFVDVKQMISNAIRKVAVTANSELILNKKTKQDQ